MQQITMSKREMLHAAIRLISMGSGFLVVGCTQDTSAHILYITLELGNPFYADMIDGLRKAADVGSPPWQLDVRAGKSADDATGQIDIMEAFLVQYRRAGISSLKGLVIVPAQSGPELTDIIRRFNEVGIPIINVDIPIDQMALSHANAHVASFVGSNNLDGGMAAADLMARGLPEGGDLLLLLGASGSANAQNRRQGFINRIAAIGLEKNKPYPVREWNCNWSASEATTATGTILASGAHIKGIFAANDEMALGAVQAVNSAQLGDRIRPLIVGYDATPDARKAILDGKMYGSISQNPRLMGEKAIEYLKLINEGKTVLAKTIIPVSPVVRS